MYLGGLVAHIYACPIDASYSVFLLVVDFKVLNHLIMVQKTLFSAMESVMNMIKEVELQERAAERAKQEAAMGGLDILVKVEELKQMLAHAKEANDMVR